MVDDEDDDWGFGDFKVAASSHGATNLDDGDDWSDFVVSSIGLSDPSSVSVSKLAENGIGNGHVDSVQSGSATGRVYDNGGRWRKIEGAIPLSVFGVEEVEEKSDDKDSDLFGIGGDDSKANGVLRNFHSTENPGDVLEQDVALPEMLCSSSGDIPKLLDTEVSLFSNGFVDGERDNSLEVNNSSLALNSLDWNLPEFNSGPQSLTFTGEVTMTVTHNCTGRSGDCGNNDNVVSDDDDEWEFSIAEISLDAKENVAQKQDFDSKKEELILLDSENSSWEFFSSGFGEVKDNEGNTDTNWFKDSLAVGKENADSNKLWQLHGEDSCDQSGSNGFCDKLPVSKINDENCDSIGRNVNGAREQLIVDMTKEDNYNSATEEWGFQTASSTIQLDDFHKGENPATFNQLKALPLSIFGEEETDFDDSIIDEGNLSAIPTSIVLNESNSNQSHVSIKDLVSSLYNQMEHRTPANGASNDCANFEKMNKNMLSKEDELEFNTWELCDAVSKSSVDLKSLLPEPGASQLINGKQKDELDFFVNLRDTLSNAAVCFIENRKKAGSTDSEAANFEQYDSLYQEILSFNIDLKRDIGLSDADIQKNLFADFVETLDLPKFQMFKSEYDLSNKLLMVENDVSLIIDLLKVVIALVNVLKVFSRENQRKYLVAWSNISTACAQELKHGASIWKNLLAKDLHHKVLSESRGKDYILALGEIYRVVEILKLSSYLYKPWICAMPFDFNCMITTLDDCKSLWSSSGLEEALRNLSGLGYVGSSGSQTLVESIHSICHTDMEMLYSRVLSTEKPICQLSLLTVDVAPGVPMISWDGKTYFLPLANLWANLVNYDPPALPSLHVS